MNPLLALAFGAGLLAPVNPCGFALLPAYLSTFLHDDTRPGATGAGLHRALGVGAAVTLGFSATLTAIGIALAVGLRTLIHIVPWLSVGIGAILILAGVAMLLGRFTLAVPGAGGVATRMGRWRRMRLVGFGVGYAVASASCTVGILLAVAAQATASGTMAGAAVVFAAYAAGSAVLLLALAVAASVANTALARAVGRAARYLPRIAGVLLAASGIYLIAYWTPSLLDDTPAAPSNPLTRLAAEVATWISSHQTAVVTVAAVVLATGALGAILTGRSRRRARRSADCCSPDREDLPARSS